MPLRKTDFDATRKFEDGEDWMVLRVGGLSKGEADRLRDLTTSLKVDQAQMSGATAEQAVMLEIDQRTAQANRALFQILCDSWSLGDVAGETYSELDEESGRWVDDCIEIVLRERRERAVKNGGTSRKPRKRGTSSVAVAQ